MRLCWWWNTKEEVADAAIEACAQWFDLGASLPLKTESQAFLAEAANDVRKNHRRIRSAAMKILVEGP